MPRSPVSILLPLPRGLKITLVSEGLDGVLVHVTSIRRRARCPLCQAPSRHIHSRYCRTPADQPCVGRPLRLLLNVRKFFCKAANCPRKVFTERLPELVEPSSRLTIRLRSALRQVGFTCGGKGGERLATKLGMGVSDTTVLWSVQLEQTPTPATDATEQVRAVGIDDWSWRRGQRYGTIIVDLERRRVLDLLPDRSVESISTWLAARPSIEIVSRDRGANYVDGATKGAPQATQVADRWHLYKNLGDAVESFLVRARVRLPDETSLLTAEQGGEALAAVLSSSSTRATSPTISPMQSFLPLPHPAISTTPLRLEQSKARAQRKWQLHQQVHSLRSQGLSLHQVVKEVGLARNTVRKYARQPVPAVPAEPIPRPGRPSVLDPYAEYLLKRWNEGCHNGGLLFGEIREQGYPGGKTVLKDYIRYLRTHPSQTISSRLRQQRSASASPRELRWLLARQREDLDEEQQARLNRLLASSTEAQQIHALLQNFHVMLRHKQHERLDCWLEQAQKSGIPEMKSFALGIHRDHEAVKAAIFLPWSQGQTEGQVNKLKTLKRAMFGRAGFPLLRQRMLQSIGEPVG